MMKTKFLLGTVLLSMLLVAGLLAVTQHTSRVAAESLAAPLTPAEIIISTTVIARDVEPLGANVTTLAGGTNLLTNNHIWGSGMEPGVARYLVRVERTGANWIEWDESLGGVHMWDQNATGFGDGATVRFYRIVDSAGDPLSYGGGADLSDVTGADHVIFLGETVVPPGGWIAEGSGGAVNRVYLENNAPGLAYGDHAIITVVKNRITAAEVHPRLHQWFNPNVNVLRALSEDITTTLVPHPGTLPPDFVEPGDTCLQITVTQSWGGWAGQWNFHGFDEGEGQWYSQLEPGATYRAELWMRQEGLPNGKVRFLATGPYSALSQPSPWTVAGEWQRFTYDFTAPAQYPDPAESHAALGVEIPEGPGTIWLDNFLVYRYDGAEDTEPFTPHPVAFDELMAALPPTGPKPSIRFYSPIYPGHSPMERLLSNYASSSIDFIYNVGAGGQMMTIPQVMLWALATGDTPADRIIPYLTLSEEYTEVEWLQLVEYLGVPYDPAGDTPESKPWAYLRYQQRGHGDPWTDEFREIVLEFGNETWHAGAGGYGWHGFGRPGWVHFGGVEYGLFARYYFVENVAAQAWWHDYDLANKITFALNANYDGAANAYGELAVQQAPTLSLYLGHANYVGPKWETGEEPFQVFDDHGMQETLVGAYTTMYDLIDDVAATREQLAAQGLADYRPIAYEGGPSGYYVPGTGATVTQTVISELYGKSLGMAVSALDAWLYSSRNGYGHQEFLGFASGQTWTSHTMPRAGGFRRHTGWLALMLRNRYARGTEMLDTTFQTAPTYQREGEEVPLMAAYALQGEGTLSVFVLSRKVPGVHDGADFGDGITPVTLHLPITQCITVTRYALTALNGLPADPAANNIETDTVALTSAALSPSVCDDGMLVIGPDTGGVAGGMPPGTAYLYVFEQVTAPSTYTLTVHTVGEGAVLREPPGTVVSPVSAQYAAGTTITLTAHPTDSWYFTGWSGDLTGGANPARLTMDTNQVVTATFSQTAPITYTLIITIAGQGSVAIDPDQSSYISGARVTLTATPADSWVFDHWSGDLSGNENPTQLTMYADRTIGATFSPVYRLYLPLILRRP